ncbi:hypothetical protein [Geomonas terrae]|nr:hypothetical protein [Geomonas terrae]
MKINRKTRYCCIAVIMAGIAVVGHAVVADRGFIAEHKAAVSR